MKYDGRKTLPKGNSLKPKSLNGRSKISNSKMSSDLLNNSWMAFIIQRML